MVVHHVCCARLSRWTIVFGVAAGLLLSGGVLPGLAQDQSTPNAGATSILDLAWPNGVQLLAGHELTLDGPQYEWRVSTLSAGREPGKPIETEAGVLLAVEGPIKVLAGNGTLVRLEAGAATATDPGGTVTVAAAQGEEPVYFMLIELITAEQAERVVPSDTVELVGPVRVPEKGDYAFVLLNLPVAVTIDVTPDEVIAGAIRPAVSIAHIGTVIPEDLSGTRNYDRWIAALYPLAEGRPAATPSATTAPSAAPAPTRVPPQPTATSAPTATATATATVTATATMAPTSTSAPTATSVPTNTPTTVPTPVPTSPPTVVPTEPPTAIPPTEVPTSVPTAVEPTSPPPTVPTEGDTPPA